MKIKRQLNGWYKLRWQVLERDKFTCQYCGQYAPNVCLEVDHKIALADGGTDDLDNLVTSCWACNRGKSGLRQSIVLRGIRREKPINSLPRRQDMILDLLKEHPGLTAKEIADIQSTKINTICMALHRLLQRNKLRREGRCYFVIQ